ncbi:MAG TPA: 4Fe-4S dicluster domain-containing protein, partial [Mobilitalea sp.]|nr:4Fe-4S dicluster domain-containing protein [Mobilitalea sp.]
TICWISPFLIVGKKLADAIRLPRLKVKSSKENCIYCNKCTGACPMSIDVMQEPDPKFSKQDNCILCGMCIDTCPKQCFSYQFTNK